MVRVSAMSALMIAAHDAECADPHDWIFQSPSYLGYNLAPQYICDQLGWGEFRLAYILEDYGMFS